MIKTNKNLSIVVALILTLIAVSAANGNIATKDALVSVVYTIFVFTLLLKFGLWVTRTIKDSLDKFMKF